MQLRAGVNAELLRRLWTMLAHQQGLLGIGNIDTLLSHPVLGASWEGWVIENLLAVACPEVQANFYRTAAGAEVDLLLTLPGGLQWVTVARGRHHPLQSAG